MKNHFFAKVAEKNILSTKTIHFLKNQKIYDFITTKKCTFA